MDKVSTNSIPNNIYIQDFRKLKVWQKSMDLSDEIYKMVKSFPDDERYGVISQIKRSINSVPANISEGNSQLYKKKEFSFANNAIGSAGETKNWLEVSYRREYIDAPTYERLVEDTDEVIRMIIGYMKKLRSEINN